jgi:hypothetical protein
MMPAAAVSRPEDWSACELVAFDVRVPGATRRLLSEGAAWRGCAHVELLDPHHAVLIIRPGGATLGEPGERRVA